MWYIFTTILPVTIAFGKTASDHISISYGFHLVHIEVFNHGVETGVKIVEEVNYLKQAHDKCTSHHRNGAGQA